MNKCWWNYEEGYRIMNNVGATMRNVCKTMSNVAGTMRIYGTMNKVDGTMTMNKVHRTMKIWSSNNVYRTSNKFGGIMSNEIFMVL